MPSVSSCEVVVNPGTGFIAPIGHEMSVPVEGHGHAGVAHGLSDRFGVYPRSYQGACEGVSCLVESDRLQASALPGSQRTAPNGRRLERPARGGAEHQVVLVAPHTKLVLGQLGY